MASWPHSASLGRVTPYCRFQYPSWRSFEAVPSARSYLPSDAASAVTICPMFLSVPMVRIYGSEDRRSYGCPFLFCIPFFVCVLSSLKLLSLLHFCRHLFISQRLAPTVVQFTLPLLPGHSRFKPVLFVSAHRITTIIKHPNRLIQDEIHHQPPLGRPSPLRHRCSKTRTGHHLCRCGCGGSVCHGYRRRRRGSRCRRGRGRRGE